MHDPGAGATRPLPSGVFDEDEGHFAPAACQFWQVGRVPRSPLWPRTDFVRWLHTDSEENYERRGNRDFSVESVGYAFNSLGYRGPEFVCEAGEPCVLFVGDSNTFGTGMPWERLWSSLVVEELSQRWGTSVRQCNMAWGGTGSDYTAMVVHQSASVLMPAAIVILWSYVGRMTWFADPRRQVHFIPEWAPGIDTAEHAAYLRLATQPQGFFNYVRNFFLVCDRLSLLGIPFYWGNLEAFSTELLSHYLPLDGYVGRFEKRDLARDGRHGGIESHAAFARLVLDAMERDGLDGRERQAGVLAASASEQNFSELDPEPPPERRRGRLARGVDAVLASGRARRRIRALKRKDPFIY